MHPLGHRTADGSKTSRGSWVVNSSSLIVAGATLAFVAIVMVGAIRMMDWWARRNEVAPDEAGCRANSLSRAEQSASEVPDLTEPDDRT